MTPLRQRMLEDLCLRNYSPNTVDCYIRQVAAFARHFDRSPDQLGPEHVREYQLFLVESNASWSRFHQTVTALRFFYEKTLRQTWMLPHIPHPQTVKRLPTVLSQQEVAALFEAKQKLKHLTMLKTLYGTGVRVSELVALQVDDIESQRELIRIRQGKGRKDRYVMLSPKLLEALRTHWRAYRPELWLFPGQKPGTPIGRESVHRICRRAAERAGLSKEGFAPHSASLFRDTSAGGRR